MSRLPITATGLSRLRREPDDLIVETSEGQTLRLKPTGQRLSQEGLDTLFGGTPPADAPQVLGMEDSSSAAFDETIEPPVGYNESNNPLQASNQNALINQARRGDKRAKALLEYGQRETRRLASQQVATERQEISLQTQAAHKEIARIDEFVKDNNLPEAARAEGYEAVRARFPKAGKFLPDPSGYAFLEELRENKTLLQSEMMKESLKAYDGDKEAAARAQTYIGMLYPDNPDMVMKFRDQVQAEDKIRREDLSSRYAQRAKDIHANTTFSMTKPSERIPNIFLPEFMEGRTEEESFSFGLDAKNPFKTGTKEYQSFEMKRGQAQVDEAKQLRQAHEEIFGALPVNDTPAATDAMIAAIEKQEAANQAAATGAATPPPHSLSPEAARIAFQSGKLLPGVPFLGETGKRYAYSAVTGKPELVE